MLEGDRDIASTARAVRAIYDDLAGCGDLRPSPRVDAAFARLVRLVVEAPAGLHARVLRHPAVRELVPRLRALCVEGEHQVERAWAHRIATSARPRDELRRFPYVENYRMLHALEWDALARLGAGAAVERVAFVGSGTACAPCSTPRSQSPRWPGSTSLWREPRAPRSARMPSG